MKPAAMLCDKKSFRELAEFESFGHCAEAFAFAIEHLERQTKVCNVIETGARASEGFISTDVWHWAAKRFMRVNREIDARRRPIFPLSIGIDPMTRVRVEREAPSVQCFCEEISWLSKAETQLYILPKTKLLYLNSAEWTPEKNLASSFHNMAVLACVYSALPSQCMIMVNESIAPKYGKHWLIEEFFSLIGVPPVFRGSHYAWIKP